MMTQDQELGDYSLILRIWQEKGEVLRGGVEEKSIWRASLENPHTGERVGFDNMEDLCSYIKKHTKSKHELEDDS
jgi:hypothetical protein